MPAVVVTLAPAAICLAAWCTLPDSHAVAHDDALANVFFAAELAALANVITCVSAAVLVLTHSATPPITSSTRYPACCADQQKKTPLLLPHLPARLSKHPCRCYVCPPV